MSMSPQSGTVLNLNLNDFPDVVPPIPTGVYTMDILKVEVKPTKAAADGTGDPSATNLVVELAVNASHGDLAGRKRTSYISTKMGTMIRRLWQSAGLEIPAGGGIDISQLPGRTCRVSMVSRVINTGGRPREVSDIDEYLIPKDAGYAV